MHEVSIAQSILDIATETARKNAANKILGIRLRVGELSCVNPDSLRFAFSCISQESIADGAELWIAQVQGDSCAIEIELIEVDE